MAGKATLYISLRIDGDKTNLEQLAAASKDLKAQLASVASEAQKTSNSFSGKLSLSLGNVVKQLGGMAAGFLSVGTAMRVVGDTVRTIADFERANSELASVLGTTSDGVKALTESAKELGRTTEFTSSEVTALQTSLARLGFNGNQIQAMEEPVLKFAAAVGTDLASAADFSGSALRAFGLQADDTGHLLDVMAKSTSASALSFSKLYESMSTVGPVANAFGLSVEDTVALLGVLSNAGFDASSAATALRNILLNLADSNGKLVQGLGHTATTMPEIIDALRELRDKGVDLNSTLEMTDKRSVAAFNALIAGADDVDALYKSLQDANGSLDQMYVTMTDNLTGAVKELQSAWEGLQLTFTDSTGALTQLTKGLTKVISTITRGREVQKITASDWRGWTNLLPAWAVGLATSDKKLAELKGQGASGQGAESSGTTPGAYDEGGFVGPVLGDKPAKETTGNAKSVQAAISALNLEAERAVEVNQLFGGALSDEAVRMKTLEEGLKSIVKQYGAANREVTAFYSALVGKSRERHGASSITDGLKSIPAPGATGNGGGLQGPGPQYDTTQMNNYTDALETQNGTIQTVTNSILQMASAVDSSAASWLAWASNLASAVAQAIPQITALVAAQKAETSAAAAGAMTKGANSVSGIPVVGPALAVAAIASIAAALLAMPKFAKGGLAYGPTIGMFGEYPGARNNPEVVAPLDRLRSMIAPQDGGGKVEFRIEGRTLVGILNKEGNISRRS